MQIKELTKLTELTSKTLRHWEKTGLLSPQRDENDYRIYSNDEVSKIFYIKSLRKLNVPISEIRLLFSESQNERQILEKHLQRLVQEGEQISQLINKLNKKLENEDYLMEKEDFELLKQQRINENEKKYGFEIRQKYGNQTIDDSNEKYLDQTKESQDWASQRHDEIVHLLEDAYQSNNHNLAFKAIQLHKEWLEHFWTSPVTKAAHLSLIKMYCDDERFRQNYIKRFNGLPEYFYEMADIFYKNVR
ncbi:MerR family transcriptional regulator [Lactococcus fujiensis]|uniref:Transcriptional regulator n=2 Tax=Lactococcus fujiensis TaxID=610251 RepID=A0A2A5RLN4_9LACT|nr:TipAS antibiotic-recognition domain-containing protein [Lactococcus fujiensis]PCS00219.1 transcriptional regulator [Lactococcus fujiensis JCM 16395]